MLTVSYKFDGQVKFKTSNPVIDGEIDCPNQLVLVRLRYEHLPFDVLGVQVTASDPPGTSSSRCQKPAATGNEG